MKLATQQQKDTAKVALTAIIDEVVLLLEGGYREQTIVAGLTNKGTSLKMAKLIMDLAYQR